MRTTILTAASAIVIAAAPMAATAQSQNASEQGQAQGQGQAMSQQQGQGGIDVTLEFLRDMDVTGANGEEVGDVMEIVQSSGGDQGLYAVVSVENGWFEEDTHIVKALSSMTIVDGPSLRLDNVTEDTIENEMEYVEDDWDIVEEEYASFEQAYEENDWDWW